MIGSSWISAAAANWACPVESCSSSSGTDSSLLDSVSVSDWGCGNSCSVAGTVYMASLGILQGNTEPRWQQKEYVCVYVFIGGKNA